MRLPTATRGFHESTRDYQRLRKTTNVATKEYQWEFEKLPTKTTIIEIDLKKQLEKCFEMIMPS